MKQRIKKLCAMLIAGTMLFSMVGCSGTESKENTKGKTQKEENTDKALYISVEKESTSSDKVEFPWYNLRLPCILMYRSLVLANPAETEFAPDMAEYEISPDGLVYTFNLKDNLKWSDGEPLTAEDVKWSAETALKATQVTSTFTTCFNYIKGAKEFTEGTADTI